MTDEPLTIEELDAVKADHTRFDFNMCAGCREGERWPCPTVRLVAEVERLLTQDGDNEKLAQSVAGWYKRAIAAEAEIERLRSHACSRTCQGLGDHR